MAASLAAEIVDMRLWIVLSCVLGLAMASRGQHSTAAVVLEDGREFSGRIVAMDLVSLQLAIGEEIVTLPAREFKKCVITRGDAPLEEVGADSPQDPPAARAPRPIRLVQEPLTTAEAPSEDPEQLPHDLRHRSRLQHRIAALDAAYPWLCPSAPTQWWSLGVMMFSMLSLFINGSVKIAGAECASFGRSLLLAIAYLAVAALQFALVPINDLSTFAMLFGDTALVLFLLRAGFGLPRLQAVLAFAVQVGFVVVAYGVLQLVDSLLRSVGTVPS